MNKRIELKEVVLRQEEYIKLEEQLIEYDSEIRRLSGEIESIEKSKFVIKEAIVDIDYDNYYSPSCTIRYEYTTYSNEESIKLIHNTMQENLEYKTKNSEIINELNKLKNEHRDISQSTSKWQVIATMLFVIGVIIGSLIF